MESEVRKLLDKAEKLVDECVNCSSEDCDECEDAEELLNEITDKIQSIQEKKVARKLSVFLDDLKNKLESKLG
ncbi:hypothetical protein SULI_04440 [Saccharolobus solfataricus]|uniref:Uncharacterized protein n=2 Tax=Saccharolobus solfataricus TaxID=2287 RepID=A0A0E3K076_SACSO|nr:hypothetical protein [Saccharolobus solfataricus]AKA73262.1 hypothetical protein SULB_0911 [Saccharolobus solfataricus]AKA75961.1 hypothetical protein SULC_0910 [Saccharolobus solfataricus]AKA78654.1 hypothetical protein SULA_0909 [Saccharolobus solfataricus]AZF67729.1 hypothetical protein SULG_04440 [Saccharolobus solfataricus]AZF70349.1 hypothetical protein SULH_04440 [Saccharolobus solfataricus]